MVGLNMQEKQQNSSFPIAAVFTEVNYEEIPFERLNQLEKAGILNIYLVLSDEEFKLAQQQKIRLFDYDEPKTILEHYESHHENSRLIFHVMNSGNAKTEKEKLDFYLNNVQEQYLTNLFICKDHLDSVDPDLRTIPPTYRDVVVEIPYLFFSLTSYHQPASKKDFSKEKENQLLLREENPCLCFQTGLFDLVNYQWLFNIFTHLIALRIENEQGDHAVKIQRDLKNIFRTYYKNMDNLEDAEKNFIAKHKKVFGTLEQSHVWGLTKQQYQKTVENRAFFEARFPKIITDLIELYEKVTREQIHANKIFISTI